MLSKASADFPDPDSPVMTTSWSWGISMSTFLRLCSRAPRTAMIFELGGANDVMRGRNKERTAYSMSLRACPQRAVRSLWDLAHLAPVRLRYMGIRLFYRNRLQFGSFSPQNRSTFGVDCAAFGCPEATSGDL